MLKEKLLAITISKTKGDQVAGQWAGISIKSIRNLIKEKKKLRMLIIFIKQLFIQEEKLNMIQ